MDKVVLTRGEVRLELTPQLGGAVRRLAVGGRELLRPTPEAASDILQTACFPMVPFCNRVRDGIFTFNGETVRLSPNMGDHPHPLHGQGWRSSWTAAAVSSDRAVLTFEHAPGEWPWAWRAEQRFTLREDGARIELKVINTDHRPMPAGLGLHPAFPASLATRLRARTEGVWLVDEAPLPLRHHEGTFGRDWGEGAPVAGLELVDHCFTGWNGLAEVVEPGVGTTEVTASPGCSRLHVYIPPRQGYLCLEPVTHMPDPFARQDAGLSVLGPGEALAIWMDLSATERRSKTL